MAEYMTSKNSRASHAEDQRLRPMNHNSGDCSPGIAGSNPSRPDLHRGSSINPASSDYVVPQGKDAVRRERDSHLGEAINHRKGESFVARGAKPAQQAQNFPATDFNTVAKGAEGTRPERRGHGQY